VGEKGKEPRGISAQEKRGRSEDMVWRLKLTEGFVGELVRGKKKGGEKPVFGAGGSPV